MPTPPMNRRSFLATSAAVSAAAFLPSLANAAPVQARRVEGPVRLGFIGLGNRGSGHLAHALKSPSCCEVVALCDTAEKVSQVNGLCVHSDWLQVVHHPDIDGVVIATPDYLHAPMAMGALQAGKHVYVETPLAFTAAEAKSLAACARRSGAVLRSGRGHFEDAICAIGQTFIEHEHRKLNWIQTHFELAGSSEERMGIEANWRATKDCAGIFAAGGFCDATYRITGVLHGETPQRASAAGGAYRSDRETPDSLVVRFEYAGGTQAVLTSAPVRSGEAHTTLRFDSGTVALADDWCEIEFPDRSRRRPYEDEPHASFQWWLAHVQSGTTGTGYEVPVAIAHEMAARAYAETRTISQSDLFQRKV